MDKNITPHSTSRHLQAADLIQDWLEHERLQNNAFPKTLQTYQKSLSVFLAWVLEYGLKNPELVQPTDILQFKKFLSDQHAPQTVNLRLSAVRSFFRFLVITGRLAANPAGDIKGAKRSDSKRHKRDTLTDEEVRAVLATCDPADPQGLRDLAIITLMVFCALRTIEIHRANHFNLKTDQNRFVLEVQGKGYTEASDIVVIPRHQEAIIRSWLAYRNRHFYSSDPLFVSLSPRSKGNRLSTRSIREIIKNRYKLAGVVGKTKTTHSLRHSAITNAIRNGAEPMQVQTMARHKSFDTTLGYIHEVDRIENPAEDLIQY